MIESHKMGKHHFFSKRKNNQNNEVIRVVPKKTKVKFTNLYAINMYAETETEQF